MRKIILFFALLTICFANAQWQTDTAVNTLGANSITNDAQSITTSDGQTYLVFYKAIDPPANFEMRVQLLNAEGIQQFGNDGMLVSNTIPMGTYTFIWRLYTDKNNNLYIALTSTSGNNAYVFKFNTQGESLWPGGLNVGSGVLPAVLPLQNTDVIIAWWPDTGKGKIQRYSADGTAIWPSPIEVAPSTAYSAKPTVVADMFEMANGDFTATFHTKLSYGVATLLFAQRYDANGIAQWTVPAQLADKGTAYNTFYSSSQDGDVIYYGYALTTSSRFDTFAQRLNPDGTLPWGINGIDANTNVTLYEKDAKIAQQSDSQYIWTIHRETPSSQGTVGEFVQKYDKATGLRQFSDTAHEVFAVDSTLRTHASDMYLINDQPLFLITTGAAFGTEGLPVSAVFLDSDGNIKTNGILPVATFAETKDNVILNKPINDYAVVTFTEPKTVDEDKIYAQRFSTVLDIPCTITPAALEDITSQCAVTAADLTAPVTTDSCGNAITATTDAVFPITQGTTTITWTFTGTDATATQTQNIIVNDTTAPTLVVQNITVTVAEDATIALTPALFDNGSTDACGNDTASWTWAVTPAAFTCADLGDQTVTITATDAYGNTATTTATVTITDPNNYCTTAGTEEFEQNKIVLYPNPTQAVFNISSADTIKFIVVYDLLGKVLVRTAVSGENAAIDTTTWATGVYTVTVENANGGLQKLKLVKN